MLRDWTPLRLSSIGRKNDSSSDYECVLHFLLFKNTPNTD
jgi:hypothetical protein